MADAEGKRLDPGAARRAPLEAPAAPTSAETGEAADAPALTSAEAAEPTSGEAAERISGEAAEPTEAAAPAEPTSAKTGEAADAPALTSAEAGALAEAADAHRPAPAGLRTVDLAALSLASVAIGVAVSAIMTDVGTSGAVVMAASALAYSGTGELAYASVVASGGGLLPATVAALLVSSRFGLLAMSMRNRWPARWWERIGIAHVASEPAVAAAIEHGQHGQRAARRAFWQLAIWMAVGWVAGSGLGLILGNVVGDTRRIGLDAVFPASFVGVLVNALRRRDGAAAVIGGAAAALALTPWLPAGLPILIGALAAPIALLAAPVPLRRGAR